MRGYWWNPRRSKLECKERGVRAFGWQLDLLTTHQAHGPSDELERHFESIDTPGMAVRDRLLKGGKMGLSVAQRCAFARLLMSLEARRPRTAERVRADAKGLRQTIDDDPDIQQVFRLNGITESPSVRWDRHSTDGFLHERSFANIMKDLADLPDVGERLINASWNIIELGESDGTFVLGDRPLIRINGILKERASWLYVLPLSPKHVFAATNSQAVLDEINHRTKRRFCKLVNISSAAQAERFVFAVDGSHAHWVGKHLSATTAS